MKRVLFLCTGNYYRSRFAEEIFNHRARAEGLPWRAFSRGVAELDSSTNMGPISPFALWGLAARGIVADGEARFPTPCTLEDLETSELVVGLKEAEHRPLIERRFPALLRTIEYWDIDDIDVLDPTMALPKIDGLVEKVILRLWAGL